MSDSSLEFQTIRSLARSRPVLHLKAGDVIFRPGDPGDCLYAIVSGSVQLRWNGEEASETLLAGSSFGVGALVDPAHRRHGTATALSETELLVMSREEFLLAVQELPMFGLEMLHDLDERLRLLKSRED
jgi:CRP/FNR family cyclic AMP-dependent transcriptional regulator